VFIGKTEGSAAPVEYGSTEQLQEQCSTSSENREQSTEKSAEAVQFEVVPEVRNVTRL
jgi:hypothetical protein